MDTALRFVLYFFLSKLPPAISVIRNNTIKIKNSILAIPAAPAAIPVKPKRPATIATTKKINVQRNMCLVLSVSNNYTVWY